MQMFLKMLEEREKCLWRFLEDVPVCLSWSLYPECEASTGSVRHLHPKRSHPPGHHLTTGPWWTGFLLKGKHVKGALVLTSFCMRVAATVPVPGAGRLVSGCLLNMGCRSMHMFSSTMKPPKEFSKLLLLQPLLLTCPAAPLLGLCNSFVGLCWKLGHWQDAGQSRKTTKHLF